MPENLSNPKQSVNKYNITDIVYVIPSPTHASSSSYPTVGSKYQIDCKVHAVKSITITDGVVEYYYTLVSGNGVMLTEIHESLIISAKQYMQRNLKKLSQYICLETNELCPKDTIFYVSDDWVINDDLQIHISCERFFNTNKLTKLFKKWQSA